MRDSDSDNTTQGTATRRRIPCFDELTPESYGEWLNAQGRGRCRACGAQIVWRKHVISGKHTPIDATPRADGNVLIEDVWWWVCPSAERGERAYRLHTVHHVTCPYASEFRRR